MMSIIKKIVVLGCFGLLLCVGLALPNSGWSGDSSSVMKPGKTIKGEVVQVDGDYYHVKQEDGVVVKMHVNKETQTRTSMKAKPGDHVEAKVDAQGHAISFLTDQPISH